MVAFATFERQKSCGQKHFSHTLNIPACVTETIFMHVYTKIVILLNLKTN